MHPTLSHTRVHGIPAVLKAWSPYARAFGGGPGGGEGFDLATLGLRAGCGGVSAVMSMHAVAEAVLVAGAVPAPIWS